MERTIARLANRLWDRALAYDNGFGPDAKALRKRAFLAVAREHAPEADAYIVRDLASYFSDGWPKSRAVGYASTLEQARARGRAARNES